VVSFSHQLIRFFAIGWINRDTDTGTNLKSVVCDYEWSSHRINQLACQCLNDASIDQRGQEDSEFIAAKSGYSVRFAYRCT
jgi:hypothetical protein